MHIFFKLTAVAAALILITPLAWVCNEATYYLLDSLLDGWMNEWMDEWANERTTEWVNEWMAECLVALQAGWLVDWMTSCSIARFNRGPRAKGDLLKGLISK